MLCALQALGIGALEDLEVICNGAGAATELAMLGLDPAEAEALIAKTQAGPQTGGAAAPAPELSPHFAHYSMVDQRDPETVAEKPDLATPLLSAAPKFKSNYDKVRGGGVCPFF